MIVEPLAWRHEFQAVVAAIPASSSVGPEPRRMPVEAFKDLDHRARVL